MHAASTLGPSFASRWQRGALIGGAALTNAAVAVVLTNGKALAAVPLALLPVALLAFGILLSGRRVALAYIALGLTFAGLPLTGDPLPLPGGVAIFATDLILLVAIGSWLTERLVTRHRSGGAQMTIPHPFTWSVLALTVGVAFAVVRGNQHYGTGLFGQPIRIILYAAIAVALVDVTAPALWRGITIVFYAGAVAEFLWALYYLATGGSQTQSLDLSTGGTRILALSTATYLVGSLVCALLNLERSTDRFGRQIGHAAIAAISFFGVVVAFGRTTFAALAVILAVLLVTRRALRRSLLWLLPLLLPALIAVILLIPVVAPTIAPTLTSRLTHSSSSDINVEWRRRGREVALEGIDQHLLTGFGFGRPVRFVFLGEVQDLTGDPHNSFVYLLVGGGLLALGGLVAVMTAYVIGVLRRLRRAVGVEKSLLIWSLCTWFAFMVNAFYGPVLTDSTMLMTTWILMIIPWVVPLRSEAPLADEVSALGQAPGSSSGDPVELSRMARS